MIIKIQQSQFTGAKVPQVLAYNKSQSIWWEGDLPGEIKKLLGDRPKAYFDAEMRGTKILINEEVEEQDW